MARERSIDVHIPREVWKDAASQFGEERRELGARRYGMSDNWQSQLWLEYALLGYAIEQGYDVSERTEIEPLPSGEIEVEEGDSDSLNPFSD